MNAVFLDNENNNTENKSPLEINANDYWFKKLRPYMGMILGKCKTDRELIRSVEKCINAIDDKCNIKKYSEIIGDEKSPGVMMPLFKVISNDIYYSSSALKYASEEEKQLIRDLRQQIEDFSLILKFEEDNNNSNQKIKERINYSSPNGDKSGFNLDYSEHNMKNLNKIVNPKTRIPNV